MKSGDDTHVRLYGGPVMRCRRRAQLCQSIEMEPKTREQAVRVHAGLLVVTTARGPKPAPGYWLNPITVMDSSQSGNGPVDPNTGYSKHFIISMLYQDRILTAIQSRA